jgi:5-methyltetrahydropteroyltriglutamate--homocysteine methyltransferase
LRAREDVAAGRASIDTLRALEDAAIDEALRKQRDIGLDILTDGEIRRGSWLTDMAEAVEGFVPSRVEMTWKGPGGSTETSTANAAGAKLRKTRMLTAHETPYLGRAAGGPFKVTLPAPSNFMIASYKPGVTDLAYPTRHALLDDIVEIIRDEVKWLVDQGVTYIQFDAPFYSNYLDPQHSGQLAAQGLDPDRELAAGIAGDNAAMADIPRESVTVAMHVCRGNSRSRWYAEGGYDAIAERLFSMVDVDTFLLEYDDDRSGGFEPLRHLPAGKNVVLGVITTKRPDLELPAYLRRRIDEAARYVPLEHLAISPQCGFASVATGNLLSMDDQWRKLELVVRTAREVWTV